MESIASLQAAISGRAFTDESKCVEHLLAQVAFLEEKEGAIRARAGEWVRVIREHGDPSGLDAFLHVYGFHTHEGIAIMCLAEALLRIPDAATADRLVHDLFDGAKWNAYIGKSESRFVNAAAWGLLLTGRITALEHASGDSPQAFLARLAGRVGEAVVREALKHAMRMLGAEFILAGTIEAALKKAHPWEAKGCRFSYDILGEAARTQEQAEYYLNAYCHAVAVLGRQNPGGGDPMQAAGISVKLSALHPRYHLLKRRQVMEELLPRLERIVNSAVSADIALSIDAEESSRLDVEMLLFGELLRNPAYDGYDGIGFVLQAYNKRAFHVIDYLARLARSARRRMPVRLVKGAYWDSEIKNAQANGLPSYPVFTRKEHTDVSYLACAQKLLAESDVFYPQFATHNAHTAAAVLELSAGGKGGFEFQRLHGMGADLHACLAAHAPCRIYAPIGRHEDLLAYLVRRLLENGANASFVHRLADRETPLEALLEDPIAKAAQGMRIRRAAELVLPGCIYPDRVNSPGYDLGNMRTLELLSARLNEFRECFWQAVPSAHFPRGEAVRVCEPADETKMLGYVWNAQGLGGCVEAAQAAWEGWAARPVSERAGIIETFAALLEENRHEALALVMREAGKTLADAIAEWREAIDFCRYYAGQARLLMENAHALPGVTGERNTLHYAPRGVFACISPWNFPLAIFTGQVTAALVTGNAVIAKPAEQTPLAAAFAVNLLHKAGVPQDVLQLAPGSGETIGAALVSHEAVTGVAFTGSFAVAQQINRALAMREGPLAVLVAETGGQNAMIVDSSALPEQVADDVIISAFGSAGQRCSALRVLYVQEEIADKIIPLLKGMMDDMKTGDPFADWAVDVGPVIDRQAQGDLLAHIEKWRKAGRVLAAAPFDASAQKRGSYVAPHLIELSSIRELDKEVFGPVLHVIRYKAQELERICREVNSTGCGLTFGLQSRIPHAVDDIARLIRAGNLYVNRSMTGATVGAQPFGGEGLSGTGPKAGGANYLLRFITERVLTINTAAIGGNLELLSAQREKSL